MKNLLLAINSTFAGMTGLFIAVILFLLILYTLVKLRTAKNKERSKEAPAVRQSTGFEDEIPEEGTGEKLNEELAAVIMAAIHASMEPESQCKLRIKSFRRIGQSSPIWNRAGRIERISKKL